MRLRISAAFPAAVLLVIPVLAADFWEKKEFTDWSEKECRKLLKKSPWAGSNSFRRASNIGSTQTGERETTEILEFRFLSTKPVRMAFGQLQLLQDPNNEVLRERIEEYVNSDPGSQILVQISYRAIPSASGTLHSHSTPVTKRSVQPSRSKSPAATPIPKPRPATPASEVTSSKVPSPLFL